MELNSAFSCKRSLRMRMYIGIFLNFPVYLEIIPIIITKAVSK